MPARVGQGRNSEHVCSTMSASRERRKPSKAETPTYVPRNFCIALLFIHGLGVLRRRLNRTGHLSGYSLIRTKRLGTN